MKTGFLDRPELLTAAGYSTLTCAFLVLVAPRVGTLLLEVLAGLCLVIKAYVLRARLRKAGADTPGGRRRVENCVRFLGRYEVALIVLVVVIHSGIAGLLRSRGVTEGFVRILPLVLFALGLLTKPRVLRSIRMRERRSLPSGGDL